MAIFDALKDKLGQIVMPENLIGPATNGDPFPSAATARQSVSQQQGSGMADLAARPETMALKVDASVNTIEIGENIFVSGEISGTGNVVRIGATRNPQKIVLRIHGNNNEIVIGQRSLMNSLLVEVGNKRWHSSRTRLTIGSFFSIGSGGRFLLPNSGNVITIGDRCMFSKSVQLRGGEYPHLIFDKETGRYLDESDGIVIGDHAWIGERAFIAKAVTIPSDCIVGAHSVVTRRFTEEHTVIAGNPAQVVKRGVQWVATEHVLAAEHPDLQASFMKSRISEINRTEAEADVTAAKQS